MYLGRDTDSAADLFLLDNGSVRGFRHARFYEQELPWRGVARCDVDKGVCVVGLEEADGGVDAGGPGVAAGGDGGAGVGGPGGAAGNAGAEPDGAGGLGGGPGGERAPVLRWSKRHWMPSAGASTSIQAYWSRQYARGCACGSARRCRRGGR